VEKSERRTLLFFFFVKGKRGLGLFGKSPPSGKAGEGRFSWRKGCPSPGGRCAAPPPGVPFFSPPERKGTFSGIWCFPFELE